MRRKTDPRPTPCAALAAAALACAFTAAPAQAGDNNIIYLLQESPHGALLGNSLQIDQSSASNSIVLGPSTSLVNTLMSPVVPTVQVLDNNVLLVPLTSARGEGVAASQRGEGNQASVTMTGNGGEVQLLQGAVPGQPLAGAFGNQAAISVAGDSLGAVIQLGADNTATLTITGPLAQGLIAQNGAKLVADLTVGAGGSGQIIQVGNNNTTGFVDVPAGASLTYTQVGNNLSPVGTTGVQIISTTNTGNISITQTGF